MENGEQLGMFIVLGLTFSFIDEKISLKLKRREYSSQMPTFFDVGVTPLIELAATGVLTFLYIFPI